MLTIFRLERFDSAQYMQNSKEDGRKNILLVCVFVACMTCTIFLAKILFLH